MGRNPLSGQDLCNYRVNPPITSCHNNGTGECDVQTRIAMAPTTAATSNRSPLMTRDARRPFREFSCDSLLQANIASLQAGHLAAGILGA